MGADRSITSRRCDVATSVVQVRPPQVLCGDFNTPQPERPTRSSPAASSQRPLAQNGRRHRGRSPLAGRLTRSCGTRADGTASSRRSRSGSTALSVTRGGSRRTRSRSSNVRPRHVSRSAHTRTDTWATTYDARGGTVVNAQDSPFRLLTSVSVAGTETPGLNDREVSASPRSVPAPLPLASRGALTYEPSPRFVPSVPARVGGDLDRACARLTMASRRASGEPAVRSGRRAPRDPDLFAGPAPCPPAAEVEAHFVLGALGRLQLV